MKKALKIIGIVVFVLVLVVLIVGYMAFGGMQSATAGPALGSDVDRIQAGFSSVYLLDAGNGQYVLIDAGADTKGTAILQALQARHASPDNVIAIFITHAHPDHDAALPLFPKAAVYTMKREVPIAAGREAYGSALSKLTGSTNSYPFDVTHTLDDGEKATAGNLEVTAFAVPGHTEGSGAYLAQGILFLGDAGQITSKVQLTGPNKLFSTDAAQGAASLKHLAQEIAPRGDEVKFIATGHSGTIAGVEALRSYASSS